MSYLFRYAAPLRASRTVLRPSRPLVSSFSTTRTRFALSESDGEHTKDQADRDQKIDHHKHESVNNAKAGKGEWKPELASNSEQAVQHDNHDLSMEEMQKMGSQKAEAGQQPAGSSSNKGGASG